MATNVSPLADDVEVNWGDREVPEPVVIDLYNRPMGMLIAPINCANTIQ